MRKTIINPSMRKTVADDGANTAFFDLLIQSSDPVWVLSKDMDILTANRAAYDLLGLSEFEKPVSLSFADCFEESDRENLLTIAYQSDEEATANYPLNCQLHALNGKTHLVQLTMRASQLHGESIFICVGKDCHALSDLQQELSALQAHFDEFVKLSAHDLAAPVRHIVSISQLMAESLAHKDAGLLDHLDILNIAAGRLQRMVLSLQEFGRITSCREPLTDIPLAPLIANALEAVKRQSESVVVHWQPVDLPRVHGSKTLLTILFENVFENALLYRNGNDVGIEVTAVRQGREVLLTIADDGIGIAPEQAETIFKPFRRLHSHDHIPGTGMGLSIARKIATLHKGKLWLDISPPANRGARFCLTLPAI